MTVIIFILILGLLVFVHELGHFVVARRNGIKADEFGFGFPPRIVGVYKNEKTEKWEVVRGSKEITSKNTLYSLNWFPIGGFVKIKGEDGEGKSDSDSFASKSAWKRIKVLLAGVIMNFILAWLLFSFGFMIGTYQEVYNSQSENSKIIINMVAENSPAQEMGIQMGDILEKAEPGNLIFNSVEDVQNYIKDHKGEEVTLIVQRGSERMELQGVPRSEVPEGEGALGIGLSEVEKVSYPFFQSFWLGLKELGSVFVLIFITLKNLFVGNTSGLEVTGIVGIAVYTGQVIPLGIVQLFRFMAILSINLGIINALPFPALDGGRVLFILIEKIKGSPVSENVERTFHTIGFMLLILLMIVVTFQDFIKFEIFDKVRGIF